MFNQHGHSKKKEGMTTVSIGIPAYNEENNIAALLKALLSQTEQGFRLQEIIVVSDASTDTTHEEVRSIRSPLIKLIVRRKRQGQAQAQNLILKRFVGDVLVLLNADVLPRKNTYISEIIAPLQQSSTVGLVSSPGVPIQPTSLVEHILFASYSLKRRIFERWKNGKNLYTCVGCTRAFSKQFAKLCIWPSVMAEDAYSYLLCRYRGFTYAYAKKAEVVYKLPDNLDDHRKQSQRFFASKRELYSYFPKSFVEGSYTIPKKMMLRTTIDSLTTNPMYIACYLFVVALMRCISLKQARPSAIWDSAGSSKVLNNI